MLNEQQFYLFGQIQTSQTRGQRYSDTSPYGKGSMPSIDSIAIPSWSSNPYLVCGGN